MMSRRGFTLAELLITAVVMAILGTMLTRMLVQDSRFVGRVEAMMSARQVARAANTVMSSDLRMVSPALMMSATATKVTFRLPIAWGMACQRSGGNVIGVLLPTDSLTVASHIVGGTAWIDSTGTLQNFSGTATLIAGPRAECTADSIRALPGGQHVRLTPDNPLGAGDIPSGSIFYTYEIADYEFRASTLHPGRIGLWRTLEATAVTEELLSPFDAASRFEFITDANGAPAAAPPGVLSTLEALELVIIGESVEVPRDATAPEEFEVRTRISFVN